MRRSIKLRTRAIILTTKYFSINKF
jgi:hypothetical protein